MSAPFHMAPPLGGASVVSMSPIATPSPKIGDSRGARSNNREPHKIRYTAPEWATVVERARASGRPPACYVREISLGHTPKGTHTLTIAPVVHELGRIGTTLARLAALAKESGATSKNGALDAALAELLTAVRRLG